MVRKQRGEWRMCVDITDLPTWLLPSNSDWLENNAVAGYDTLSFLDLYKGFHHVLMNTENTSKTTFIKVWGIFSYKKMSFGSKNIGGYLVEARWPDLQAINRVEHWNLCWQHSNQKPYNGRLCGRPNRDLPNSKAPKPQTEPNKIDICVSTRIFMGHTISSKARQGNLTKVNIVVKMRAPKTLKDIQTLTRWLTALGWFISKSANKQLPFFQVLKQASKFRWTPACGQTF